MNPTKFAVQELKYYFFKVIGIKLRVNLSDDNSRCLRIDLEKNAVNTKAVYRDGLKEEEFVVRSSGLKVDFCAGSQRALLYSIYTFLEECCGLRWFYPDKNDECIQKLSWDKFKSLLQKGVDIHQFPSFSYRDRSILECQKLDMEAEVVIEKLVDHIDWMAKNTYLILKTILLGGVFPRLICRSERVNVAK